MKHSKVDELDVGQMLGLIYGMYMLNMIYGKCCLYTYGISLLVFNSRSYLFTAWYIKLNTCREIPYKLKILFVCCTWYIELSTSISVYIHVLFYSICCHFFLFVFLILGNIPIGPASILSIFFSQFTYSYYTSSGLFYLTSLTPYFSLR